MITKHLKNIFLDEELNENSVCAFFAHTTKHGAIEGKNEGNRSIWFNGKNKEEQTEHIKPQFEKYALTDFCRILEDNPDE